jgi:5-methylcytosine-specific restriction endonuclease McrA
MTKEQDAARKRIWRKDYPEKHREDQRKNYAKNRKKIRKRQNTNRKLRPDVNRTCHANRRTASTKAGGRITTPQWLYICKVFKYRCLCCGKVKLLCMDHIVPVSKGGSSWPTNIQPLCMECNSKKHTKSTDFRVLPKWRASFAALRRRVWFGSESQTNRKSKAAM